MNAFLKEFSARLAEKDRHSFIGAIFVQQNNNRIMLSVLLLAGFFYLIIKKYFYFITSKINFGVIFSKETLNESKIIEISSLLSSLFE